MDFLDFCELCKEYRQQKGVTIDLLSRSTGIKAVNLYKFEHGDRRSINTFLAYLNFFGGDLAAFIYVHWKI